MSRCALTILLVLLRFCASAQVLEGKAMDRESKTAIQGVVIVNKHSGISILSDTDGYYHIHAAAGDTLLFTHIAYQPATEVMVYTLSNRYKTIEMESKTYSLKGTTITGLTKYQQDSLEKHTVYAHDLNKTLVAKPQYTGLGCSGCIGWMADKITGNSKKAKQFRKQFASDDKSLFIDSRYTPETVTALTEIRDTDSVAAFIYAYPMPYDFARAATDLEVKIWIRDNYKQYLEKLSQQKRKSTRC